MSLSPFPHWHAKAACRREDPELFFPVGKSPAVEAKIRHAKVVCFRCPVSQACGQGALDRREPIGIWGGMTVEERRALLRRRGIRMKVGAEDDAA